MNASHGPEVRAVPRDQEEAITCLICKQGEARPGRATVTMQRGDCTVIFKGVPADVCENCGEY